MMIEKYIGRTVNIIYLDRTGKVKIIRARKKPGPKGTD